MAALSTIALPSSGIDIAPLRDRLADIDPMAFHFLHQNQKSALHLKRICPIAQKALREFSGKGNSRELENVIRTAMIQKQMQDAQLCPKDFDPSFLAALAGKDSIPHSAD